MRLTTLRHAAADRLRQRLAVGATAAVLLASCGGGAASPQEPATPEEPAAEQAEPEPDPEDEDAEGADPAASGDDQDAPDDAAAAVDPAEVGADELGLVPVLMYHQLREDGGSDWDMTPDEFRAELIRLFDSGYVPITTADLARGHIDVPAGHSPVVLTFDDSTRSQARLDETGAFAADTSMGILVEVAAAYDHIEPVASFYVITSSLFGGGNDGPDILAALHDAGVEIGNHSHTHPSLRSLDGAGVQEELATNVATVRGIVADAEVATLSLPLGIYPEDSELARRGSHGGIDYEHIGVLQVGYNPNVSPFHVDFDGAGIARIQTHPDPAFEFGSAWWLDQLDRGESYRRFVSDGDPDTISFPADRAADLAPAFQDRANPY